MLQPSNSSWDRRPQSNQQAHPVRIMQERACDLPHTSIHESRVDRIDPAHHRERTANIGSHRDPRSRRQAALHPLPRGPAPAGTRRAGRVRAGARVQVPPIRSPRGRVAELGRAHHPQARPAWIARADRRLASAVAGAVPDQRPPRAYPLARERRGRARPRRLPADLGQQHPRARLRPPPEGQQGTGRRNDRVRALGHDHADPHRRRTRRAPVDPARHGRRNPRPRPAEDQRRPRVRRTRRVRVGHQELAGHPDQSRGRSQLRKLPCS